MGEPRLLDRHRAVLPSWLALSYDDPIEIVRARSPGKPVAGRRGASAEEARGRGPLVGKGGLHDNVIRLAPPMTLTGDELDEALEILAAAIAAADAAARDEEN